MLSLRNKIINTEFALKTFIFMFALMPLTIEAAGASFYLSPNAGTFYVGNTFDVSVFVNTGDNNVNAVQAVLKFDPKKLQIASPTAGKSFISVWIAQPSYSNIEGTASFQGGIPSPGINTSSGLVSTITFRAISPGETTISFSDSSQILLDDGKGTNILTSVSRGVYRLSVPPPEGPEVFSSTHPDQNKWYKNNNPTFSWIKEEGFSDFSYDLNEDPQGIPDSISDGSSTSVSYQEIDGGIWYFHIKAKKAGIWGGTSHYLAQIDNAPPANFTPKVDPSTKTSVLQPIISFITTDALSGFSHFELKVIDITPGQDSQESGFFTEVSGPYKLPSLKIGKYLLVVRAFDNAGNWRDSSVKLEIIPQGLYIGKDGVFFFGLFLKWWVVMLFIFIFSVLIALFFLNSFKKQEASQIEVAERLKIKEAVLKDEAENINIKTDQINEPR
ncbi:MAG: cohesin domain-containing protein [Parcubacteria group bacterium]